MPERPALPNPADMPKTKKADIVGRVVVIDPALVHGENKPILLELHRDHTITWRPLYPSRPKHSPSAGAEAAGQAIKEGLAEGLRGHEPRIAYIDEAQEK